MDVLKQEILEKIKTKLIEEERDFPNLDACGYYATLTQFASDDALTGFFEDTSKHNIELHYEEDKTGGYSKGNIVVYLYDKEEDEGGFLHNGMDHFYRISLGYDDRYHGYCMCTPDMPGYDPVHNCCGNGCDWSAPQISIEKETHVHTFSFSGEQNKLWEYKLNWSGEGEKVRKQELLQRLEYVEENKKRLALEENKIKKELEKL